MDFTQARVSFFEAFDATVDLFAGFFEDVFNHLEAFAEGEK